MAATPPVLAVPAWQRRAQKRAPQGVAVTPEGPAPSVGGVAIQRRGPGEWVVKTHTETSAPKTWAAAATLARAARAAGCKPFAVVAPGAVAARDEVWLQQALPPAAAAAAKADGGPSVFPKIVTRLTTAPPTGPAAVAPSLCELPAVLIPGATAAPYPAPDVVGALADAIAAVPGGADAVGAELPDGPLVACVLAAAGGRVCRAFVPAPAPAASRPAAERPLKRPRRTPRAVAEAILAASPPLLGGEVVAVTVPADAWPTVVRAAAKTLKAVTPAAPRGGVFVLWGGKVLCNGAAGVGALLAAVATAALFRLRDEARDFVAPESAAAKLPLPAPRRRSTTGGSVTRATLDAATAALAALGMDTMGLSAKHLRETTEYLAWMMQKDVTVNPGPPCHSDDRQRGRGCLKCAGIDACRAATGSDAMDEPNATPCSVVAATLERPPCLSITEAKLPQRAQLAAAALTMHNVLSHAAKAEAAPPRSGEAGQ